MSRDTEFAGSISTLEPTAVPPAAWDALADDDGRKRLVEQKIVLPILRKDLARKHGLQPPRAILLFGPTGTGKTHFVRAIAARLGWALIEADLSPVALYPARLAELFNQLFALRHVVVFFDEFEHLGMRRATQNAQTRPVTNEFLKRLDTVSKRGRLLLACATNHVDQLDPALLRPGRFDFVLPVGPPDAAARAQLLEERLSLAEETQVEIGRVVAATEHLTAADIVEVWNQAAQRAFERELANERTARVTTDDLLAAVATHRPSLSHEDLERFQRQVHQFARP
jgi:transitional endoplasmic reticulum ATPase